MGVEILHAGSKNVVVVITGALREDIPMTPLFDVRKHLTPAPDGLRIDEIQFALQEKLGFKLWWGEERLILPVESRGGFKFKEGLRSPRGWDGVIHFSSFNFEVPPLAPFKEYFIYLDMERLDK